MSQWVSSSIQVKSDFVWLLRVIRFQFGWVKNMNIYQSEIEKSLTNCSWSLSDVVEHQMAAPLISKHQPSQFRSEWAHKRKNACSVATRATSAVPLEVLQWWNLATATQGGKQFHQMSHRNWARCLHMTERDEERRWGARFSYCSSCPCVIFFTATLDDSQADAFLCQPSNFPFPLVSFIFPLPRCLILSSISFQLFFF